MISLALRALGAYPFRLLMQRHGTIKCLAGGRLADFAITLARADGDQAVQAVLRGYPRWSEPLTGLVARCLALVADESETPSPNHLRLATLSITLERCQLAEAHLIPEHASTSEDCLRPPTQRRSSISLWSLMQKQLADEVWGMTDVPPLPEPVSVPVYQHGAMAYCRARDLPHEARVVFDRWRFGRARPDIPGVGDAVHVSDVEAFLG